jgi:hypothetical protein
LTDKYRQAKLEYVGYRAIAEADKELSLAHIGQLTNAIGQANETIVQKERVISEKSVLISRLSNQLDDLISNEPVQPELESQPLVISLRKQVSKLTDMFNLSQETVTLQSQEIDALGGKCAALESIGAEWKQMYDKEHKLRLLSEGLVTSLEHRVKAQGLLGTAKAVAIGVTAGCLVYSLLK